MVSRYGHKGKAGCKRKIPIRPFTSAPCVVEETAAVEPKTNRQEIGKRIGQQQVEVESVERVEEQSFKEQTQEMLFVTVREEFSKKAREQLGARVLVNLVKLRRLKVCGLIQCSHDPFTANQLLYFSEPSK